ncbi:MAG: hypothetical protein M3O82_01190 [Verrucomicrobiota bacterium]|nr:hypothetical protein [Verrucomicrobiota bacterium]
MQLKQLDHGGWKNNLLLANEHVELIISLDVGPRILSYKTVHGENVLKNYPEQFGQSGEVEWKIRGGHRFWLAPEDEKLTYVPDNVPVIYDLNEPDGVRLENAPVEPWRVKKEMSVSLDPESSRVTIVHRATNEGPKKLTLATWGLTVMAPGGLEIIPAPALGEHPRDLLPQRVIVPWPYTDLSDPRWRFGWRFTTLRQTHDGGPTKLGLAHREKWVAYVISDAIFVKTFDYEEGALYPDLGCNFETFTNQEMLEIESLSPLRELAPGDSVSHTEQWFLLREMQQPESLKQGAIAEWIEPLLKRLGLTL